MEQTLNPQHWSTTRVSLVQAAPFTCCREVNGEKGEVEGGMPQWGEMEEEREEACQGGKRAGSVELGSTGSRAPVSGLMANHRGSWLYGGTSKHHRIEKRHCGATSLTWWKGMKIPFTWVTVGGSPVAPRILWQACWCHSNPGAPGSLGSLGLGCLVLRLNHFTQLNQGFNWDSFQTPGTGDQNFKTPETGLSIYECAYESIQSWDARDLLPSVQKNDKGAKQNAISQKKQPMDLDCNFLLHR